MFSIADNLENVRQVIKKAAQEASRAENEILLLAVSKTQGAEVLKTALAAGLCKFGENYLNEAIAKQDLLKTLVSAPQWTEIEWHFIGPIQSNKTKAIAERFDWVQSVDRLKIARRLNSQRVDTGQPLNVCIQINIDSEESKSGVELAELHALAEAIDAMEHLCLRGLMAIPRNDQPLDRQAASFDRMAQAFTDLKRAYPTVDTLSLGMSSDMALAIKHGSTMIRVGTALFGARGKA